MYFLAYEFSIKGIFKTFKIKGFVFRALENVTNISKPFKLYTYPLFADKRWLNVIYKYIYCCHFQTFYKT